MTKGKKIRRAIMITIEVGLLIGVLLAIYLNRSFFLDFILTSAEISTAEELDNIRDSIRKRDKTTFKLKKDISLSEYYSWEPIELSQKSTFDGNGFSITGLKIKDSESGSLGLFSTFKGTIKNLKLEVEIEGDTGVSYMGAFAGKLVGPNSTIENCKATGSIKITGEKKCYYVGGFVGYLDGASIKDSNNYVNIDISKGDYIGGFSGNATNTLYEEYDEDTDKQMQKYHSGSGAVTSSVNYGSINVQGDYVGGIIGKIKHTGVVSTDKYSTNGAYMSCNNLGDITATNGEYVGGIYGKLEFDKVQNISYGYLYNSGKVKGKNYVGGIIGNAEFGQDEKSYSTYLNVSNLENTGDVEGNLFVGGIFGQIFHANGYGYYSKLKNTSSVTGVENVGGIVGLAKTVDAIPYGISLTIAESTNSGDVTGLTRVGGIAGSAEGETKTVQVWYTSKSLLLFKSCTNNGKVKGTGSYIGGITGYASKVEPNEDCVDNGD